MSNDAFVPHPDRLFPADPAVREAAEAVAMILDLFAPHTAEEMWEILGYKPFVGLVPWRAAEPTLLVEDTVTAVVQIDGKVRGTLEVSARIDAAELERLARGDARVQRSLGDRRSRSRRRRSGRREPRGRRARAHRGRRRA